MSAVVDEIKQRLDIAQVLGEYIRLNKVGPNFRALCPFHNEKTPSFHLDYYKGLWHCFGCGKGGDLFTFVQEIERLDFPATLKLLAKKAGVTLPESANYSAPSTKVYELLEEATLYYEKNLWLPLGAETLKYLKNRGVREEMIREFHLGLALNNWDSLYVHLRQKNYSDDDLIKAGLCLKTTKGNLIDRFRNRLMFPIRNQHNQVIAFAGRRLSDADSTEAKYVNSPDSSYYHKGEILYNLSSARTARPEFLIVVEGYMDVLMSHQAGLKNVVALSGTALTERQATLLARSAPKIYLALDQDEAGQTATIRSLIALLKTEAEILVIEITGAKDTAELVEKNPVAWLEAVEKAQPYLEVLLQRLALKYDQQNEAGRKIAQDLVPILSAISDSLKQASAFKIVASAVSLPVAALTEAVQKHQSLAPAEQAVALEGASPEIMVLRGQEFLRSLMFYPEGLALCPDDLGKSLAKSGLADLYFDLKNAYNAYKTEGARTSWVDYVRKLWIQDEVSYTFLFVSLELEPSFSTSQLFKLALRGIYLPYLKERQQILMAEIEATADTSAAEKLVAELSQVQQLYHSFSN